MTTTEGNKLIAEFMGYEIGNLKGWVSGDRGLCAFKKDGNEIIEAHPIDRLKYHSSWDWLMPVVKKVNEIFSPLCNGLFVSVAGTFLNKMYNAINDVDILKAHSEIIEAIQWYNTQTKTP